MVRSLLWGIAGRLQAVALLLALLAAMLMPAGKTAAAWEPPDTVYFPATGHNLSGGFLDFWRENGRLTFLGSPISEQFKSGDLTVQYFEKARLELHGDTIAL